MPNLEAFLGKIDRSSLSPDAKALMTLFVDFFKECSAEKNEEIAILKKEVKSLNMRLQSLEDKQDVANQYSRLDTLTLSPKKNAEGSFHADTVPIFDSGENTKTIVRQLFKDHLKLDLADNDISIAHRLQAPKKANNSSTPSHDRRNIIVRFCRKDLMGTVFQHCKEMTPPFYVNESLTPLRSNICYALRTLKRKYNQIEKVRTFKGVPRVFIRQTSRPSTRQGARGRTTDAEPNLTRIEVATILELETFAKSHLKTTLQEEKISMKTRV